jgi:hypothetical protein
MESLNLLLSELNIILFAVCVALGMLIAVFGSDFLEFVLEWLRSLFSDEED